MTFPNRYPAGMSFWKIRRGLALVVAVVLAAGLVTHGFGGPDMVVTSAVTAAHDMPMPGDMPSKCDGCAGDERGLSPTACSALCGSVIAAPLLNVVLFAVPAEILSPTAGSRAIGRTDPPDPYPPRRISVN
jgi:hypothetical protein